MLLAFHDSMIGQPQRRFRVGLSFPGERRAFVGQVAAELAWRLGKHTILYDKYIEAELARPNLDLYLTNLYRNDTELLVPFFGADYERKKWTKLEWRQMRDILFDVEEGRIMPFRFDDTLVSGTLSIDGSIFVGTLSPADVAELIVARLDGRPPKPPQTWPWWMAAVRGAAGPAVLSAAYAGVLYPGPPVNPIPGIAILSVFGAAAAIGAESHWRWRPAVGLVAGFVVWGLADILSRLMR
jgi:hypothetical protein